MDQRTEDLRAAERALIIARWVAVPFSALLVLTPAGESPEGMIATGLTLTALLAMGNALFMFAHNRMRGRTATKRISVSSMAFDFLIVSSFVFLHTFDEGSAIFTILYLIPLEGALRYGRRGALTLMAAVAATYVAREVYGNTAYGYEVLWQSITFRMGVGFLISIIAGAMAERYMKEYKKVQKMYQREKETANSLREIADLRDTLLSSVSHELRTPLTSIFGFAITLKESESLSDTEKQLADYIVQGSERLGRRLDELVYLEQLSSGKTSYNPHQIDVVKTIKGLTQRSCNGSCSIDAKKPVVGFADSRHFDRIIENLLDNAVKYGGEDGLIEISVKDDNDMIHIVIQDEGPGISYEDRELIFEPFRRGSAPNIPSPGIGLGLALAKKLAELNNGILWADESANGGAAFHLKIPAATNESSRMNEDEDAVI